MKLLIVALKDVKVGAFQMPQCVAALGAAVRGFEDATKDPAKNTDLSRHPADFELYELGTYNDENASFELHATPKFIVGGANV